MRASGVVDGGTQCEGAGRDPVPRIGVVSERNRRAPLFHFDTARGAHTRQTVRRAVATDLCEGVREGKGESGLDPVARATSACRLAEVAPLDGGKSLQDGARVLRIDHGETAEALVDRHDQEIGHVHPL